MYERPKLYPPVPKLPEKKAYDAVTWGSDEAAVKAYDADYAEYLSRCVAAQSVLLGDQVIYHDEFNQPHAALITAQHGLYTENSQWQPSVNLLFVHSDAKRKDQYGQQIQRESSVVHTTSQGANGRYWRFPDEPAKSLAVSFTER